jgi:hypothetical protein
VLRRSRAGAELDVLAAGGGGGGGSGSALRNDLDAREASGEIASPTIEGAPGTDVATDVDGGGGGGGGGGLPGGVGGDTFSADVGGRDELFGRGGRRGSSIAGSDEVTIAAAALADALGAGSGTVRWHAVEVSHSVQPTVVAPTAPVAAAGVAAASDGASSTLTVAFRAAVAAGTHTYAVWEATADLDADPAPSPTTSGTIDGGLTTFAIGPLDLTESHVVRVTHTDAAGTASSTLTLVPQSVGASGAAGATFDGAGGSGGAGAAADPVTLTPATSGFAPTAVHFALTGASGGAGGADGSWPGGAAGLGQRISGTLAVRPGDTLGLHAGGGGGEAASNSKGADGGGGGGASTIASSYGGGVGGRPGPEGTSGGGGGGGSATVLRCIRGPVRRDVVAAGGGGGGGTGNGNPGSDSPLDARAFDASYTVPDGGTLGEAGEPKTSGDGGGGGGGGGGVVGGGRGDLFTPSGLTEQFGRGGRRGRSSTTGTEVTVTSTTTPGQARDGGAGTVRWHAVSVSTTDAG